MTRNSSLAELGEIEVFLKGAKSRIYLKLNKDSLYKHLDK
jgi:hypothetical protein